MALTPRGAPDSLERRKAALVNSEIEGLADGESVLFLDIGEALVDADGTLPPDLSPDGLHLSARGYDIVARKMTPVLNQLLSRTR